MIPQEYIQENHGTFDNDGDNVSDCSHTFKRVFKLTTSNRVNFDISSTMLTIFSEYSMGASSGDGAGKGSWLDAGEQLL